MCIRDRLIGARVGTGMLSMPKGKPGLSVVTSATFDAGGLKKHSSDELRRIFAGKTVTGSFSLGDDACAYVARLSHLQSPLQRKCFACWRSSTVIDSLSAHRLSPAKAVPPPVVV